MRPKPGTIGFITSQGEMRVATEFVMTPLIVVKPRDKDEERLLLKIKKNDGKSSLSQWCLIHDFIPLDMNNKLVRLVFE